MKYVNIEVESKSKLAIYKRIEKVIEYITWNKGEVTDSIFVGGMCLIRANIPEHAIEGLKKLKGVTKVEDPPKCRI